MPTTPEPEKDQDRANPAPPTRSDDGHTNPTAVPQPGVGGALVLASGQRPLPDYELVSLLGRGGFGEVWKARGPGGFHVALKFVRLEQPAGETELRALELMKEVRHAHLLATFGAWQQGSMLVIAMELADGTLLDRLRRALANGQPGIPASELLEYMREAAKGLDYLNEFGSSLSGTGGPVGIQHKDVKPQNLLLAGGTVKVADFGLAKVMEHTVSSVSRGLTPAYAAPEFFKGQATRWSDQYSLAVAYCQLRGGRLPFEGNHYQLMAGHVTEPPDLSMLPPEERPVAARALAKKPDERWPTCRAFVEALAEPGRVVPSPPPPAPDQSEYHTRLRHEGQAGQARWPIKAPIPAPGKWQRGPIGRRWACLVACVLPVAAAAVAGLGFLAPLYRGAGDQYKETRPTSKELGGTPVAEALAPKTGGATPSDVSVRESSPVARPEGLETIVSPQKGTPFTNSVGIQFGWIKPGSFAMGSPDGQRPPGVSKEAERTQLIAQVVASQAVAPSGAGEPVVLRVATLELFPKEYGREEDEKPHLVTLTRGFHMGTHLVTQAQWEQVLTRDANHSTFLCKDGDEKKKLPVDNISWFDCVEFCIKLSEHEGRTPHYRLTDVSRGADGSVFKARVEIRPDGTGYRLPTEAEWEYACRAGTTTPFWQGNTITASQANYDSTHAYGNGGQKREYRQKTTPVDYFSPNFWGLHDMGGNLWQWCEDRYGPYLEGPLVDPFSEGMDESKSRVLRGGSWRSLPSYCRAACREKVVPTEHYPYFGCRVVLCPD
jgi:formylglycine-generating enzyme required for sulfatase activity/serine/threonine protein kinase